MSTRSLEPDRLRTLVEGAASVAGQTDLQAVLANAIETAMELTGARYAALGVLDDHGTLSDFVHRGIDPETALRIGRLPEGRGVLGLISRGGKTLRLDDLSRHPAAVGVPPHHPEMQTFLGVPIRAGDDLFGNLYLTEKEGGFTDEDQSMVEALAMIVGAAVRTVRLQRRLRTLAIAADRERIAMELHDAIIQDLFAVGLSLQAQSLKVPDTDVREALMANAESLDRIIATLRRFIFELPSEPVVDLRNEIRDLITGLAGPYDVAVEVSYTGTIEGLGTSMSHDIRQFVSEAVSNALRHSGTERITVHIDGGPRLLTVEVVDEGYGFDPETAVWGLGIANLQQRVDRAGGTLEIASEPGQGTTVRATLPR